MQTITLFFALFPDAETAARISALIQSLRAQHGLKGKALDAVRLHVSLHWLDDYQDEVPENVLALARQAAASMATAPFSLAFDHAASFPTRRPAKPFVLLAKEENAALKAFQRTLGQTLKSVGLGRGVTASYKPHVTLLYDQKVLTAQPIEPLRWTAQDFVLVQSLVGKSHYDRLNTWPLSAP